MFQKITVGAQQKALLYRQQKFRKVLNPGDYFLWRRHHIQLIDVRDLSIAWDGVAPFLHFNRQAIEAYWQIIETSAPTLIWHPQLSPRILPAGGIFAFWKPEQGEIESHVLGEDAWIPEALQAQLLKQNIEDASLRRVRVAAGERLLFIVHGQLQRILEAGHYLLPEVLELGVETQLVSLTRARLDEPQRWALWQETQPELVERYTVQIQAAADEIQLQLWQNEVQDVLLPQESAWFWRDALQKNPPQRIDLKEGLEVSASWQPLLEKSLPKLADYLYEVKVQPHHEAVLYRNQRQEALLSAGTYWYWQLPEHDWEYRPVDLRLQSHSVQGQELMSADKVALRLNATLHYRVTDSVQWLSAHQQPEEYLHHLLQWALRALVSAQTLEALLGDKKPLDEALLAALQEKNIAGIEITGAGIKDIILSGEMRTILAQVVEAEKAAQANTIRRREETAATRSLLNTARVLEDNPSAWRLKELEVLEKVAEKIDSISVQSGLRDLLKNLIQADD